jgi:hypothetical protein
MRKDAVSFNGEEEADAATDATLDAEDSGD